MVFSRIEAILADIERLDRESGGNFRQTSDMETAQIVARIERKMLANNISSADLESVDR